jgi:radical SAM protein with 4Fe4S-binding SPASM domain
LPFEYYNATEYMDKPFSIFNIELTNHCIMKCVMCPRTNNMTRDLGYISLELYNKVIDELLECNPALIGTDILWLHHFGESLLHPEFGACIRYASDKNIRTGLSINPIMLKDEVIDELLSARPHIIYISLDGHDEESFFKIRGVKNSYGPSRERLSSFLRRKVESKSRTVIVLSMVDFELNTRSIEMAGKYWESMPGIDQFLVKSFTRWDGSASDVNSQIANRKPLPVDKTSVRCAWPFERMTILWDGDVVPCCFDYDKKYVLGNIKESRLIDIWNGEKIQQLRDEFLCNCVRNPLCVNCERLYLPSDSIKP